MSRRDRERVGGDENLGLALGVNSPHALIVGDEEPLLERGQTVRPSNTGGEGNGLTVVDDEHIALALAGDIDLAPGAHGDCRETFQPFVFDERLRQTLPGRRRHETEEDAGQEERLLHCTSTSQGECATARTMVGFSGVGGTPVFVSRR